MQTMFGAGCFWGVEDSFKELNVIDVTQSYGGKKTDKAQLLAHNILQKITCNIAPANFKPITQIQPIT